MSKKYETVTGEVLEGLKKFKGFYSQDYYLEFEDRISQMKGRINDALKEGRLLKLGIVGEVKAGKSSFLNALIFDGEDILPKASTPMTAALTKITYANDQNAKIFFYSEKDWERIESISCEYDQQFEKLYKEYIDSSSQAVGTRRKRRAVDDLKTKTKKEMKPVLNEKISSRLKSCKELTELAKKSKIDIREYLGKEHTIHTQEIKKGLSEYIGADGDFTAIVKHVELQMNNELLKGIEIIDTPGLNDPIISRGETTKQFLGECDVVFLLSYCGQFLSQEDISFMCETLPNEGIRNIVLVGSKFDSGILDNTKAKSLKQACSLSINTYNEQARENIDKCLVSGYNADSLRRLKNSLPPSYVSSLLYSCSKKERKDLSEIEEHIIKQLDDQFEDFSYDSRTLLSMSGIHQIRKNKIAEINKQKQTIIEERNCEVISDNKKILLKILEDINIQAINNREEIRNCDKDKLKKKLYMLQTKLNTMRREIRNIFDSNAVEAEKFLNQIGVEIELEIDNYIYIDVKENTHVEHETYSTGFLGLRKEHYTNTVTTYSASVSDAISNIRNYITRCKLYLNEEFEKIVNINTLKSEVKETVIGAFDLGGKDFNENDILIPLEIVMKKIQIPKIDIEAEQFESMIIDEFSGAVVEGKAIQQLKLSENRVLGKVSKAIKEELKKCQKRVDGIMTEQSSTFIDNIIHQLSDNIEKLKNQIDDKENSIKQYDMLCNSIDTYKKMVMEMEM